MNNKKVRKNEALLWFGSWTSRIGNIVFDYANSVSIVRVFAGKPWILAIYQSSETMIQIIFAVSWGFIFTMVFWKSGSLIPCIIAHAMIDVFSVFGAENRLVDQIYILATAIVGIVYCIYLSRIKEADAE